MAGKFTQHLQSERGEPFVESVGKMIDMLQLQGSAGSGGESRSTSQPK